MDHEITEVANLWMRVPRLQGRYHGQLPRSLLYARDLVDTCNQPEVMVAGFDAGAADRKPRMAGCAKSRDLRAFEATGHGLYRSGSGR